VELCEAILDGCTGKRTYENFFSTFVRELCRLEQQYYKYFERLFEDQYEMIHHLDNVKLRISAEFFADLLIGNVISWRVCINF
jgi:hypothetical protein